MPRTPEETAAAIAEFEAMFGLLDYFVEEEDGTRVQITSDDALDLSEGGEYIETLYDLEAPPYVLVTKAASATKQRVH